MIKRIFPNIVSVRSFSSRDAKEKFTSLGVLALILALIFASGPLSALVIETFLAQTVYNAGDTIYTTINVSSQSNEIIPGPVRYSLRASNGSYEFANRTAAREGCDGTHGYGYAYNGYGYGYGYGYAAGITGPCNYEANFTLSDFQANGTYTLYSTVYNLLSNQTSALNATVFLVNSTPATGRVLNENGTPLSVNVLFTESTNHSNNRSSNVIGNFSVNFNPNKRFKIRITPLGLDLPSLYTRIRSTPYPFGDIVIKKSIPPGLVKKAPGAPHFNINVGNETSQVFNTSVDESTNETLTQTGVVQTILTNMNATTNTTVIVPVTLLGTNRTVNLTLAIPNATSRPVVQISEQGVVFSPQNASLTDVKITRKGQELKLSLSGSGVQDIVFFLPELPKRFRFNNGSGWIDLVQGTGLWQYAYSSVPSGGYLMNATVRYSSPANLSLTWRSLNGTTVSTDASFYSSGATVTVSGTVKDDQDADVSGATVRIYRDGSLINTTTGGAYSYAFSDSTAATHTILVNASLDGYVSHEVSTSYSVSGGGGSSSYSSENVTAPEVPPSLIEEEPEEVTPETPDEVNETISPPVILEPDRTEEIEKVREAIINAAYALDELTKQLEENPDAISILRAARQKLAQADLALSQGNYAQAERLANEAKALMEQARGVKALPDRGIGLFPVLLFISIAVLFLYFYVFHYKALSGKPKAMTSGKQIRHLEPVLEKSPLSKLDSAEDHTLAMEIRYKLWAIAHDADILAKRLKGNSIAMSLLISVRQNLAKAHLALSKRYYEQARILERKTMALIDKVVDDFHIKEAPSEKEELGQAETGDTTVFPQESDVEREKALIKRIYSNISIDRIRRTFQNINSLTKRVKHNSNALSLLKVSKDKLSQANRALSDSDYTKARDLADEAMAFMEQAKSFKN